MTGKWLSVSAVLWALHDAEDVPSRLVSTLVAVAAFAAEDGTGAYPSAATVAVITRKTERAAKKDLAELRRRGLLLPGDRRLVKDIRADRRPCVYDLPMPRGVPQFTPNGMSHSSPRPGHGVSGKVARGVREGNHGVSHSSPEESFKETRTTRSGPAKNAGLPPARTTCTGCGRPFPAGRAPENRLCRDCANGDTQ